MSKSNRNQAIERLRAVVKEGDQVFTILRHTSRSGMNRVIQPVILRNNEPLHLGYNVAQALEWGYDGTHEGVKVSGCGMDMGFHLVYELSSLLFGHESQGGYKLSQRWL